MDTIRGRHPDKAPGARPLLGHAWALKADPGGFITRQRQVGGVVELRIGPVRAYLVNDPALVHDLLSSPTSRFMRGGPLYEAFRVMGGNGLANSEGPFHRKQRRLVQPALHASRFPAFGTVMSRAAVETVDGWHDGHAVRVDRSLYGMSARIMSRCLYSGNVAEEAIDEIVACLPIAMDGVGLRAIVPVPWLHAWTPENRRYRAAVRSLHRIADRMIEAHRDDGGGTDDVLTALRDAADPETGLPMPAQQIHDEVISLLIAAVEAPAVLLGWALHVIGAQPRIEERIREELDRRIGPDPLTYESLVLLPYLNAVVSETLRLHPPIWLIPRTATADVLLGEFTIPGGSLVLYSAYGNHHDPELFPEPDAFLPERWMQGPKPVRGAFVPFGSGAHKCLGDNFSVVEAAICLGEIVRGWSLRPHPDHPVRPQAFTTFRIGRHVMTAHRRTRP